MNKVNWIIEPPKDLLRNYHQLFEGESDGGLWTGASHSKLNFLWNENNVYVMDNHLAAGWCWIQKCVKNERYNFLHIDQHSDDGELIPNDYNCDSLRDSILNTSIDEYSNIQVGNFKLFSCDSYIRPIARLFPEWFSECKFAISSQYKISLNNYNGKHDYLNNPTCMFANEVLTLLNDLQYADKRWIVNIDLDYIYNGDDEVLKKSFFLELGACIEKVRDKIVVVTIALSPTWCNGLQDSLSILEELKSNMSELKNFTLDSYL